MEGGCFVADPIRHITIRLVMRPGKGKWAFSPVGRAQEIVRGSSGKFNASLIYTELIMK